MICNIAQMVCGNSKQSQVMSFALFGHVKVDSSTSLHLTTSMNAISAAQCSSVISLLNVHQIQDRTGLGKSNVGRISKAVLGDKENCPRGCPSKLSSHDQHSII